MRARNNEDLQYANPFGAREAIGLSSGGLEKAIYDSIDKTHLVLNETELNLLARQLQVALARYQAEALKVREVRDELYRWYNERSEAGLTTSVFAAGFNMSVKDHNKKLKEMVDLAFTGAYLADLRGSPANAAAVLIQLGLRNNVLNNPKVIAIVQSRSPMAAAELARIEQYRLTLFRCIMPLAAQRARSHAETMFPGIDYPDMVQEAFIAAIQALEGYVPMSDGKTLTSFIYTSVNGHISKRKSELGRNVRVPRTVYERYVQLLKAASNLYIFDFFTRQLDPTEAEMVAAEASKTDPARGAFTVDEVTEIHGTMQSEYSLDLEFIETSDFGPGTEVFQYGDLIESDFDIEADYDTKHAKARLMTLLKQFSTKMEYDILSIRWGRDDVKSYVTTANIYHEETGRPMNKTTVSNTESAVFKRIRQVAEKDEKLRDSFMQIWISLNS